MVFVVAMDQRQWYIATDRTMRDKVSDTDGLKHIEDAVLPLLKKGNYMEAFEEYAHSSGQLLATITIRARPMISPMPFNGWIWRRRLSWPRWRP